MSAGTTFATLVALLALPAAAAADVRHASPGGSGTACTSGAPCGIEQAVESASGGDEVVVGAGTYVLGPTAGEQLDVSAPTFVHGAAGQPAPVVVSTAPTGVAVTSPNALVRRLEIVHGGGGDALLVDDGSAEQLVVRGSSSQFACHVRGAQLNDSVCWATAPGGLAAGMIATGTTDFTLLRNVTAVATAPGSSALHVEGVLGGFGEVDGSNVIARGGAVDIEAESDGSGAAGAAIVLDYSNFGSRGTIGPNTAATPPDLGFNQIDPPVFADAAVGDFHEHPDSPTIERGTAETGLSTNDVDGEARFLGYGPDIGADEYLAGPPPADVNPPDTKILKGPDQRTKRHRALFKFGTTEPSGAALMCSVDGRPYQACDSPKRVKVGGGPHVFLVFSIDASGNVDPTPDEQAWRVKRKHKKKSGGHGHGGQGGGGGGHGGGHK